MPVEPTPANGLSKPLQVSVDEAMSVKRDEVGPRTGHLDAAAMLAVTRAPAAAIA